MIRLLLHSVWVLAGAVSLSLTFFLVLPLIQAINKPPASDMLVQPVSTAQLPPPPPPIEEEPEEDEPEDEPELQEDAPPLDLSQLELALNPGFSGDWPGGDVSVALSTGVSAGDDLEALFSLSDLDQRPRVVYQPSPVLDAKLRSRAPGTVEIIFVVNAQGRVENPIVRSSSDPVFERSALAAVRQWKFEPGKRNGEPVRFRMLVPITFPEG